jgi:plasmid stability protein
MAQFVVRKIENEVRRKLRRRAARHGRSMEEEVREILRDAVKHEENLSGGLGSEIAALFKNAGLTSPVRELRRFKIKPPSFRR